jgi:hypothetical protein
MALSQEQVKYQVISSSQGENGLQETVVAWVFPSSFWWGYHRGTSGTSQACRPSAHVGKIADHRKKNISRNCNCKIFFKS